MFKCETKHKVLCERMRRGRAYDYEASAVVRGIGNVGGDAEAEAVEQRGASG